MSAKGAVKIRVSALPVTECERHPYLTHFQHEGPHGERARTVRVMCSPTDTVRTVKMRVQDELGERVEMLKRGGVPEGEELDDSKTLAELGLGERDMSVWEHLWVDSEARIARMEADKEKMMSIIHVHPNDMTPKMIRALKECCPPRF